MSATLQELSEYVFSTALEILQIIELMERQNTGRKHADFRIEFFLQS
jgi:hypothetical protein